MTLLDKEEFKAKVVGTDPKTDIALIKIDAKKKLAYVALGDSDKARGGRMGPGDRQPVRARPHRDGGDRQRQGADHRLRAVRRLHPDRRLDQPGELGRPPLQPEGRGRRDQHGDRPGRAGDRLRHADPAGQVDPRAAEGQGEGDARVARGLHPAAHPRGGREPRDFRPARGAGVRRDHGRAGREGGDPLRRRDHRRSTGRRSRTSTSCRRLVALDEAGEDRQRAPAPGRQGDDRRGDDRRDGRGSPGSRPGGTNSRRISDSRSRTSPPRSRSGSTSRTRRAWW